MLYLLIRKEIAHNVLSFRFIVTYALLFALVLLAMFLMSNDYRNRVQGYATEFGKQQEQVDRIDRIEDPDKQLQEFQQTALTGTRRPRSLSILARGLDGELPTRVVADWFYFSSSEERLGKNMLFEIFRTPDFAYVVNIVMSLLALLFVFDAICGEKEQGTLKLLLSSSVPRDTVLLGKWIGGYVSAVAPFVVAVLGGFTYIYVTGALDAGSGQFSRAALIFLLSLLYISAFFTLGLLISALTHRGATALLVSLLVWIGWILVIPNLAPVVARLAAPVPSRQVIEAEKQAIDRETQLLLAEVGKHRAYGNQEEYQRLQQEGGKRKDKLDDFYQDRMQAQISLAQNLARVSPSASFLFAATRLAGTGPNLYQYFQQARERYRKAQQEYRQGLYQPGKVEWTQSGPRMKDPDWFNPDQLPRFSMAEEPLGESFGAALFDILLLAVFNVLFFMLAYALFLRYDIT
jgi:ABC-type transport system involved in multi-copper enzyme maturation permease subunit